MGVLILSMVVNASGSPHGIGGQLSSWGFLRRSESAGLSDHAGIRYIPWFARNLFEESRYQVDMELSWDLFAEISENGNPEKPIRSELSPYRGWIRFSTNRLESRLGLQKISFGQAKLLRSLMWFDRLDPRDPLQLADGVYGLRVRYDLENNANAWLWALYGNTGTKGWEGVRTRKNTPEYGARLQYPLRKGEMALTVHHRSLDPSDIPDHTGVKPVQENRVGLDGAWDMGVGLWFETALIHSAFDNSELHWQSFFTLGADYTFPVGNGLHVMVENLLVTIGDSPFDTGHSVGLSGFTAFYPLGIMDQVSLFGFYNWGLQLPLYYLSWQRTYDNWIVYSGLFWTSPRNDLGEINRSLAAFGEKGIMLMIIFNH